MGRMGEEGIRREYTSLLVSWLEPACWFMAYGARRWMSDNAARFMAPGCLLRMPCTSKLAQARKPASWFTPRFGCGYAAMG